MKKGVFLEMLLLFATKRLFYNFAILARSAQNTKCIEQNNKILLRHRGMKATLKSLGNFDPR